MSALARVKEYAERFAADASVVRPLEASDCGAGLREDEQNGFTFADSGEVIVRSELVGSSPFDFEGYVRGLFASDVRYGDGSSDDAAHGGENFYGPLGVCGFISGAPVDGGGDATGYERDDSGDEGSSEARPEIHSSIVSASSKGNAPLQRGESNRKESLS